MTATGVPVGYAQAPPTAAPGVASATAAQVRVAGQEDQPGKVWPCIHRPEPFTSEDWCEESTCHCMHGVFVGWFHLLCGNASRVAGFCCCALVHLLIVLVQTSTPLLIVSMCMAVRCSTKNAADTEHCHCR